MHALLAKVLQTQKKIYSWSLCCTMLVDKRDIYCNSNRSHYAKKKTLTFDTMLVDVDYHEGQAMFLLYDLQEIFSTLKLVDCFKRRTHAKAFMHLLHALFSVAFQATFILFLDQFVLLNTHLEMRRYVIT